MTRTTTFYSPTDYNKPSSSIDLCKLATSSLIRNYPLKDYTSTNNLFPWTCELEKKAHEFWFRKLFKQGSVNRKGQKLYLQIQVNHFTIHGVTVFSFPSWKAGALPVPFPILPLHRLCRSKS